jgi:hypothetical protein
MLDNRTPDHRGTGWSMDSLDRKDIRDWFSFWFSFVVGS